VSAATSEGLAPIEDSDHVLGAGEPALTVIEYGDFGCPFCFAASRPLQSLLDRYHSLRLVWRHSPDPELHPGADLAAELSELAAVHGKFWEAHSILLTGRERLGTEDLLSAGERLDLDRAEVESAIRDRTYRERVLEDLAGGRKAGVHGTPAFFVDGERLVGHWRQLAQVVPAALSEQQP
jgi:protein-disulfide isomerase